MSITVVHNCAVCGFKPARRALWLCYDCERAAMIATGVDAQLLDALGRARVSMMSASAAPAERAEANDKFDACVLDLRDQIKARDIHPRRHHA